MYDASCGRSPSEAQHQLDEHRVVGHQRECLRELLGSRGGVLARVDQRSPHQVGRAHPRVARPLGRVRVQLAETREIALSARFTMERPGRRGVVG